MVHYAAGRLAAAIPLLALIALLVFVLGQYAVGDLALHLTMQANAGSFDQGLYDSFRQRLQLDDPVLVRFWRFLSGAVVGDFGVSYVLPGTPQIGRMLGAALPVSLQLGFAAMVLAVLVGVPLGVVAGARRNTPADYAIVGLATILSATPVFVLAPIALVLLVVQLRILPGVSTGWHGLWSTGALFPAAFLATRPLLGVVRYTRASVVNVLPQDYVRTARAKGLSEWRVITGHVVRNALTPVLTVVGLSAAQVLSGAIFVEAIFNIRGLGFMAVTAFQAGDVQVVAATTLVTAALVVAVNLIVDLLYGILDPRVRVGRGG